MDSSYSKTTLARLGAILAPKADANSQLIFANLLKNEIIPWGKRETDLTKEELVHQIKRYVKNSFKTYTGSINGAYHYEASRELCYQILWGVTTADSLMNRDFLDTGVSCGYDAENDTFTLSLIKHDNQIVYSERQLKWCKENAPVELKDKSDNEIITIMYPAWSIFGNYHTSLPVPPPLTEAQRKYVKNLAKNCR